MKVLLVSADKYELTDENTGELRRGSTLWYLNDYREDTRESMGHKPTKISGSVELIEAIAESVIGLPAYAELSFITKPGAGGKASLMISGVKIIKRAELF